MATSKLYVDPSYIAEASEDEFALAFARIEWCVVDSGVITHSIMYCVAMRTFIVYPIVSRER
jgi:hypothetical protein